MLGRESTNVLGLAAAAVVVWFGAVAVVEVWWLAARRAPAQWLAHPELRAGLSQRPALPGARRLLLSDGNAAWWALALMAVSAWCVVSPPYDRLGPQVAGAGAVAAVWAARAWIQRRQAAAVFLAREELPAQERSVLLVLAALAARFLMCWGYVLLCVFAGRFAGTPFS